MTNIIVFHLYDSKKSHADVPCRSVSEALHEAVDLCQAIDLTVCHAEAIKLRTINAGQIFSDDRLETFKDLITLHNANVVMINWQVSPIQQRNLEKALGVKVLDRIGLILEIFGERASTKEGKLQVELARMKYQKSRLVKAWSHLERQRGGGGFTGGPGETQQEADRRMIDEKIIKIEKALSEVVKTRQLHRSSRKKVPYPVVALAGYTNAGKSTLFNQLTGGDVLEADMLFATLDPTLRTVRLPSGDKIILSDTVGFISNLPTQLVKAFRATLEEVLEADLILHIRDIASEETLVQCHDVQNVLKSLDKDRQLSIIEVFNKCDIANSDSIASNSNHADERNQKYVICSAKTKQGIDDVLQMIDVFFECHKNGYHVVIPTEQGDAIAAIHRLVAIKKQYYSDDNTQITIDFHTDERRIGILRKDYPNLTFNQNVA
jgi:GTP-binding protein HflX